MFSLLVLVILGLFLAQFTYWKISRKPAKKSANSHLTPNPASPRKIKKHSPLFYKNIACLISTATTLIALICFTAIEFEKSTDVIGTSDLTKILLWLIIFSPVIASIPCIVSRDLRIYNAILIPLIAGILAGIVNLIIIRFLSYFIIASLFLPILLIGGPVTVIIVVVSN